MSAVAIDNGNQSSRAIVRAAEYLRRQRMDKPAKEVVEFARAEAKRELFEALMRGED